MVGRTATSEKRILIPGAPSRGASRFSFFRIYKRLNWRYGNRAHLESVTAHMREKKKSMKCETYDGEKTASIDRLALLICGRKNAARQRPDEDKAVPDPRWICRYIPGRKNFLREDCDGKLCAVKSQYTPISEVAGCLRSTWISSRIKDSAQRRDRR